MISVIEVQSRKDLNDFITLPLILYAQDPLYVPPLIREMRKHFSPKNPFFTHASVKYFLAKKDGKPEGRIVSIFNRRHIEYHQEKAGFFGFFESTHDPAVASALLDKASEDLGNQGIEIMRGPMNFSTNEECGFLIEGFQSHPILMTPYNPPYYSTFMEGCGMVKAKDLYAYILDVPEELPRKIHRVAEIAVKSGIRVRPIDMRKFHDEMKIFKEIYNSAWANNWGFIPSTDEEVSYLAENLKPLVVPELILIAEKDSHPVGFMGMLPDFNFVLKYMRGKTGPVSILKALYFSRKIRDLRMLLLGIRAEYRNRGVDALLFREGFRGVRNGGYRRVEFSWILEDNIPVQRLVEMIGGILYKKYRLYQKQL